MRSEIIVQKIKRNVVRKVDVVNQIAKKTGVEKRDVKEVVELFFDMIKDSLCKGENAYFRGFGSFVIKKRAKKIGRIISTNTAIVVPAHNIPKFKPTKSLAASVKKNVKA